MKKLFFICSLFAGVLNAANNDFSDKRLHYTSNNPTVSYANGTLKLIDSMTGGKSVVDVSNYLDLVLELRNTESYTPRTSQLIKIINAMENGFSRSDLGNWINNFLNEYSLNFDAVNCNYTTENYEGSWILNSNFITAFKISVEFLKYYSFGFDRDTQKHDILNEHIRQSIVCAIMLHAISVPDMYQNILSRITLNSNNIVQALCEFMGIDTKLPNSLYTFFQNNIHNMNEDMICTIVSIIECYMKSAFIPLPSYDSIEEARILDVD